MLILNTGGTFNKRYNPLSGELEVPYDNLAVEKILSTFSSTLEVAGVIYKDSLDMDTEDRKTMASIISASQERFFIVIHGTDTMHLSALFLDAVLEDKVVVLTGAMVPFEIDPLEATANLAMALGFAKAQDTPGVYICMQGLVARHEKIVKNRALGKFEIVED